MSVLISWCQRVRCTFLSDLSSNRSFQPLKPLNKDTRLSVLSNPLGDLSIWTWTWNMLYIYTSTPALLFPCNSLLGHFVVVWGSLWGFFFGGGLWFFCLFVCFPGTCACTLTLCHIMSEYWYFISSTLIFPKQLVSVRKHGDGVDGTWILNGVQTEPNRLWISMLPVLLQ